MYSSQSLLIPPPPLSLRLKHKMVLADVVGFMFKLERASDGRDFGVETSRQFDASYWCVDTRLCGASACTQHLGSCAYHAPAE